MLEAPLPMPQIATAQRSADTAHADALLVLGMHRGGTSALAGALNLLGFDLGSTLMPAADGVNNKGFWEHFEAFKIHERLLAALGRSRFDPREMPLGWRDHPAYRVAVDEVVALIESDFDGKARFAVKDPRMCRLAPVWLDALRELGIRAHAIIIVRHPSEVARSMRAQGWVSSSARAHLCWLQHMLEAEQATRDTARALVTYDALLDDWRAIVERVGAELGLPIDAASDARAAKIDAFLDAGERHYTETFAADVPGENDIQPLAADLMQAALRADDPADAWGRFAAVGEVYRMGAASFGRCLDEAIVEASISTLEAGQGRATQSNAEISASVRELAAHLSGRFDDAAASLDALRAAHAAAAERIDALESQWQGGRAADAERMIALETERAQAREQQAALARTAADDAATQLESLHAHVDAWAHTQGQRDAAVDARLAQISAQLERLVAADAARFRFGKWFGR